jgi:hypothetical protein
MSPMTDQTCFDSADGWRDCIKADAEGIVPPDVWERRLAVGAGSVTPLIRTACISATCLIPLGHDVRHERAQPGPSDEGNDGCSCE